MRKGKMNGELSIFGLNTLGATRREASEAAGTMHRENNGDGDNTICSSSMLRISTFNTSLSSSLSELWVGNASHPIQVGKGEHGAHAKRDAREWEKSKLERAKQPRT